VRAQHKQKAIADIIDSPLHRLTLQRATWQALLHDMMNDDVIGTYDPVEVATAFREIVSAAPNAATQPALLRALMRRRLAQGMLDTYESLETARIEALSSDDRKHPSDYVDAMQGEKLSR
jgi:hypothetical protein